jgi:hypothetical protein
VDDALASSIATAEICEFRISHAALNILLTRHVIMWAPSNLTPKDSGTPQMYAQQHAVAQLQGARQQKPMRYTKTANTMEERMERSREALPFEWWFAKFEVEV